MKILIISTLFHPRVGGIETVTDILANEFSKAGHEVRVLTDTRSTSSDQNLSFAIERHPSIAQLFKAIKWSNISLHSCISLKYLWPFFLIKRPLLVIHHTWYRRPGGSKGLRDRIKLFLTNFTNNISVSHAIQKEIPAHSKVIGNPYDDKIFTTMPDVLREKELVFLGRLVSDKGTDILLNALAILRDQKNMTPRLSIIGDGPELPNLKSQVTNLALQEQVTFLGEIRGSELALTLNQYRIMVIPSKWEEPYGIVALEGLACGLKIIASSGGGLGDAIGGFGVLFQRGNSQDLAEKIQQTIAASKNNTSSFSGDNLEKHLKKHAKNSVAAEYLAEMQDQCSR